MSDVTSGRKKILVVDDEPGIRDSLKLLLKSNFEVHTASDGAQALELVEEVHPDLILLDVIMPNLDGMETLRQLRSRSTVTPVIMLTATNTVKTAVQAIKWGAVDYLNKPFDLQELTSLIIDTLEQYGTSSETARTESKGRIAQIQGDFGMLVGSSPAMQDVFKRVGQIAERDTTVLITGESGTGKELVAKEVHRLSRRKDGPFIPINCAAIPETLIESELFGHEKGAFTHAIERRVGHFELANGGTLFLDEIGELSPAVQVKMLRFLQEQEFYRIGRSKPIKVDVRIVAATNKKLEDLIKEKKFRQDLYYRVNVINITLPPLRDRFEDIEGLVRHFLKKFAPCYSGREAVLDAQAMKTLIEYDWPGNVRELENVIESLLALNAKDDLGVDDLPAKMRGRSGPDSFKLSLQDKELNFEEAERVFESEMILKALKRTNYVQTRAAELLGISRRILKYKMDKLGISDQPEIKPESEPAATSEES